MSPKTSPRPSASTYLPHRSTARHSSAADRTGTPAEGGWSSGLRAGLAELDVRAGRRTHAPVVKALEAILASLYRGIQPVHPRLRKRHELSTSPTCVVCMQSRFYHVIRAQPTSRATSAEGHAARQKPYVPAQARFCLHRKS
jgi:hypothetical protein